MQKKRSSIPLLLVAFGGVLLSLAVFMFIARKTSSAPSPQATVNEQDVAAVPRLTLIDAKAALDSGAAVFVDVRSADAYALGHIPGALSIPLGEVESRMSELNPSQWIIPYCT